jgi:hypothetical protein
MRRRARPTAPGIIPSPPCSGFAKQRQVELVLWPPRGLLRANEIVESDEADRLATIGALYSILPRVAEIKPADAHQDVDSVRSDADLIDHLGIAEIALR